LSALSDLRIADLMTLLAVTNTGTITGAARELCVTPSQVSKTISRLERHFGVQLFARGANGVTPTPEARRILPRVANAMDELRAMADTRDEPAPELELTVAGPSYLMAIVLPRLTELLPRARMRGLELPPPYMRAHVADNLFDVALAPGGMPGRPASWTSDSACELRSVLLGRPALAKKLGPLPLTVERVRALSFIGPVLTAEPFSAMGDDCPLLREQRLVSHEVQSIGSALEMVAVTDHVVFGPVLAARRFLREGAVVELPVVGWDVRDPLHVVCNGDRVLSRVRGAILRAASEASAASADVADGLHAEATPHAVPAARR
jgi:DNA-binding transcriptional LysR family regulator